MASARALTGGALDAEAVAVEEDVQAAQAQFAVAPEQGEARRPERSAPEPDSGPRQRRERFLVQVRSLASAPGAADPGPQRLGTSNSAATAWRASAASFNVASRTASCSVSASRRARSWAGDVRAPCRPGWERGSAACLGHQLVPRRVFAPVCERPLGGATRPHPPRRVWISARRAIRRRFDVSGHAETRVGGRETEWRSAATMGTGLVSARLTSRRDRLRRTA